MTIVPNQSSKQTSAFANSEWKPYEKTLLRFFFIYFLMQLLPVDWEFYKLLFSINWFQPTYADLFNIAHYTPNFISASSPYVNLFVAVLVSFLGTWSWKQNERKISMLTNYERIYYLLWIAVRYRLAIALLAYGFIKLFPLQFSYPSISQLNTKFGDYTDWKLFMLSLGIVPSYESFLGLIEIIAALLLLNRKTASIGAFIAIFFLGNVFFTLLAYSGGEAGYSLFLLTLALFVFAKDAKRLYQLIIGQPAFPTNYRPLFKSPKVKYTRIVLKGLVIFVFLGIYGFKTSQAYRHASYQYPNEAGLKNISGIYNVSEFKINDELIPYSTTDSLRWKDVVFEKWNTISIASNRPVIIDSNNIEKITLKESEKIYELEGASGRHYYSYTVDSIKHTLKLHNKNKHHSKEVIELTYEKSTDSTLVLSGLNENENYIRVVLDKLPKRYLLEETKKSSRRSNKGIKI